jgi:PTH2 family peptidyl-tRNA hydrolase
MTDLRQILIIRKDLNMRRGKECAQAAHASLMAVLPQGVPTFKEGQLTVAVSPYTQAWLESTSFTKICVTVNSEAELLDLRDKAQAAGLPFGLVLDSGRTEFHGVPTHTVLSIGPAPKAVLQPLTGHLPLY